MRFAVATLKQKIPAADHFVVFFFPPGQTVNAVALPFNSMTVVIITTIKKYIYRAVTWRANFSRALNKRPINVQPSSLVLPQSDNAGLWLHSWMVDKVSCTVD